MNQSLTEESYSITEKDISQFDAKAFDDMLTIITEFMMRKALHYNKPQNRTNMSFLGSVGFWFEVDEQNVPKIHFTKHPSLWNHAAIKQDIEIEDYNMLRSKGFITS